VLLEDLFYVQIISALRASAFSAGEALRFGSLQSALDECERLQADFDCDCEPRRVYVLDAGKIPVWAAGARGKPPNSQRSERNPRRAATS